MAVARLTGISIDRILEMTTAEAKAWCRAAVESEALIDEWFGDAEH